MDIDIAAEPVTLRDVFCGIGIETDQGCFGIAQRDGGIEVLLDGVLVWSSSDMCEENHKGGGLVNGEGPIAEEPNELLAEYAHKAWSSWMEYLFEKSYLDMDGCVSIPADLVARWTRQMNMPYKDLPEEEKGSDRAEALKMQFILRNNTLPK